MNPDKYEEIKEEKTSASKKNSDGINRITDGIAKIYLKD